MVIGLKQVRVSSGNLIPSPSTENHSLLLSELADRNKHFWQVREQALFLCHISQMSSKICPRL